MGEPELLEMLATETDRRAPTIAEGVRKLAGSSDPDVTAIEEIRVEVHGLKGAAGVVGQTRLAELALAIEVVLVQRIGPGLIPSEIADPIVAGVDALQAGARAAASGDPEPASVAESISALKSLADA